MYPRQWLLRFGLPLVGALGTSAGASAGQVEVVFARLLEDARGWRVEVTLRHADTGWDHYANAWRIVAENGQVLGERILHHPHVNEQPFTRGLGPVAIPAGAQAVYIEGQDNVHGANEQRLRIDMQQPLGERYEVQRTRP